MKLFVGLLIALVLLIILWRPARKSYPAQPADLSQQPGQSTHGVGAQSAARRALCLASLVLRAKAEYQLHPSTGDAADSNTPVDEHLVVNQKVWMKQEGLWDAASPRERALLEKPLGTWNAQEVANGQWREEALAVLLWALRADLDLAPYDQPAFATDVMKAVPHPSESQAFISRAALRSPQDIENARDTAELWLWRARTTQLQRDNVKPPQGMTFEKIIAMTAAKAQKDGLFHAIDNDFPAFHKSYAKLSPSEWQTMSSISTERLYALNWLCGYSDDWDDVSTDT